MSNLTHDVRIALRGFRRTPTFVVSVLAILGLGIGMATAMFATFQAILVRRLPVQDQDRVAVLWTYRVPGVEYATGVDDSREVGRVSHTMRGVAGVAHWGAAYLPFVDGGSTMVLGRTFVTGNFFQVLGAHPILGRFLRDDDERPGAAHVMVLSYAAWQSQFGGRGSIVGHQLYEPYTRWTYTVVGVAPPGLDYPAGIAAWSPVDTTQRGLQVITIARLAPGATLSAARDEFFSIVNPRSLDMRLTGAQANTFTETVLGDVRPVMVALTAAVAMLLLIACVNVGNLFLLRAGGRARELAVRRALGASFGALVRQLVAESAIVAIAGGALGVACAAVLVRALVAFAPPQLPRLDDVQLHANVLGAALGVTMVSVLLFGVLPALMTARAIPASPLRLDARGGTETRRRRRTRDWLVASQAALALLMLAGAGLLARSLQRLERLDLGFPRDHLSIVTIAYSAANSDPIGKLNAWGQQVTDRLRALPGAVAATPIMVPPFRGVNFWHPPFDIEGRTPSQPGAAPSFPVEAAGADYFHTFDIPVLRGRAFTEADREGAPDVAIVSESVARQLWPHDNPLGKRLRIAPPANPSAALRANPQFVQYDWRTVVGVVPDTHFRSLREASPMVYFPWRQFFGWQGSFAVRSSGDVAGLPADVRRAVHDVDPTLTVFAVHSIDDLLRAPLAEPRLSALLLTAFGVVALVLAAVGLYGVMATTVREQTREIGIRVALGATPAIVRDTILRRALVVAGVGTTVGLAMAFGATRLLRSLLFEVSPTDPLTFASVSIVLLGVALLAAYLPARRATRIDPAQALRSE